jgi:hypothetical protein
LIYSASEVNSHLVLLRREAPAMNSLESELAGEWQAVEARSAGNE